jgi:penicillin V acylase-like amidase (Ntn superfamily)
MGKILFTILSVGVFTLSAIESASACTTVAIPQSHTKIVANSLDWNVDNGMAIINQRKLKKTAFLFDDVQTPAKWTSQYASITFNQYGREFPIAGMNEEGLVVENMWLESSMHPEPDAKPALIEVQWIQYQLDQAKTVEEAIALADKVRVSKAYAPLHYLVCDRFNKCATFEYISGKLKVHPSDKLPIQTLTNSTYDASLSYALKHKVFGGALETPTSGESLDRFVRASALSKQYDAKVHGNEVPYAFDILKSVAQDDSVWNLVYERDGKYVHFRTKLAPAIKSVQLKSFKDLNCGKNNPVQILDMNTKETGDVTLHFSDYTTEANKKLVEKATEKIAPFFPPGSIEKIVAYPENKDYVVCDN